MKGAIRAAGFSLMTTFVSCGVGAQGVVERHETGPLLIGQPPGLMTSRMVQACSKNLDAKHSLTQTDCSDKSRPHQDIMAVE